MAWNQFIGITMLLFALTNPVGAIPIFLAMTRQAGSVKTHRIIILASAAVAIFFVGSIVLGKEILSFFNVGLDDFRIAGGLLALVIAFEMFQTQHEASPACGERQRGRHSRTCHHAFCISAPCRTGRDEHHDHTL